MNEKLSKNESEINQFNDLKEVITLFKECKKDPELAESLPFTIQHAVEIMYGIEEGYLRWDERKNLIAHNQTLLNALCSKEVICFQECTKPSEMLTLIKNVAAENSNFQMLKYHIPKKKMDQTQEESGDWCVIIYDANKFNCTKQLNFSLANKTKPCILARLESIHDPSTSIIIGSVHLPGGNHSDIEKVIAQVKTFSEDEEGKSIAPSICVLGDFNHHQSFFSGTLSELEHSFLFNTPDEGTMAGPDFGNTNIAVDGALSRGVEELSLSTIEASQAAHPITMPFQIEINL